MRVNKTRLKIAEERRRQAEIALHDKDAQLKAIIRSFIGLIYICSKDYRIEFVNDEWIRRLGHDPTSEVCYRAMHARDSVCPWCVNDRVFRGETVRWEVQSPRDNRHYSVVNTPIYYADGTVSKLSIALDVTEEKQSERAAQHSYDIQSALNSLLHLSMKEETPLERILKRALNILLSLPWLAIESKGSVFLVEEGSEVLVMTAQKGLPKSAQKSCARVPFGMCICGRAASTRQIQFVDSIDDRHEVRYEGMTSHGHYCVPILSGGKPLGVIDLYVRKGHTRDREEEEFLKSAADVLAGIIERYQAREEIELSFGRLRRTFQGVVSALATVGEKRDPYTAGHDIRVTRLACAMAREMGFSSERIEAIYVAGILHDIGKLYVPSQILNKPGRLTGPEFGIIKSHPQVSFDILSTIEFPWPVAEIVSQHHERMDGSGYSKGLRGEEILVEARILAVADVIEAMTFFRPYRPALGIKKALDEIRKNRGKLYDPKVVDACLKVFAQKRFKFE